MGNIEQFKIDFKEYQDAKEKYITETISFEIILTDSISNHTSVYTDTDILNDETSEGVPLTEFLGGEYSNRFVQVGLDELEYDSDTKTISQITNVSQITPDISFGMDKGPETCRNACDGYAKMKNKPYYGLEIQNDTSDCNCYVMDSSAQLEQEIIKDTIVSINNVTVGINNYAYLYNISNDKYKVGKNIMNRGYIGYDGKFYDTKDMSSDDVSFQNISEKCLNITYLKSNNVHNIIPCKSDSNCIGYFIHDLIGNTKITDENKHFLYHCSNKNENGKYYHKKYTLGLDYPNCIQNASYTKLISYDEYDNSLNHGPYEFQKDKCGFDYLLKEERQRFIDSRQNLQEIMKKVIISFNQLSENELELLDNIKLKDIAELKSNYNELRDKAQNQYDKFHVIKRQSKDSEILYKSIQYKTALVGVVSIMAVIALFRIAKK